MHEIVSQLRILIVATNNWPSVGRLMSALIKIGFKVAVVCPSDSPIKYIQNLTARYEYRPQHSLASIKAAIADSGPLLLVCNDDLAVRELHAIYGQARTETGIRENAELTKLIKTSLGNPSSFGVTRSKSRLLSIAQELNIRCPPTIVVNSYEEIDRQLGQIVYPVLIKLDESWGGRGVRFAQDHRELLLAVLELSFPLIWPTPLKRAAARFIQYLPGRRRTALPKNMSIQHYISGRPANCAVVCWQGKVLAGISVEAIETASQFGPTTLARIIEHGELTYAAEKIVANQELSGFLGFDFMLDRENQAWFLEMNPRATPTCHLCFRGSSLPASLFLAITGRKPNEDVREVPQNTIAIFPNRISRQSLDSCFYDAPEGERQFTEALKKSVGLFGKISKGRNEIYRKLDDKIVDL
jgi:hypothetical protein